MWIAIGVAAAAIMFGILMSLFSEDYEFEDDDEFYEDN